jgi:hypothetical protein
MIPRESTGGGLLDPGLRGQVPRTLLAHDQILGKLKSTHPIDHASFLRPDLIRVNETNCGIRLPNLIVSRYTHKQAIPSSSQS